MRLGWWSANNRGGVCGCPHTICRHETLTWPETYFAVCVGGFCPVWGGLATVAAWQTNLTVGNATITSGEGWGNIYELPQVAAGDFDTFALKDNGDVWAWGKNDKGQLGDGTTNSSLTPVKVADGHKFVQISAGYDYTLAIDTDGYAWAWGGNDDGKLGNGTTTGSTTPVQVSGGHKFRQITTDYNRAVALDTNGNIWAWGRNDYGQLGNGTTTNSSTPVQVKSDRKFRKISSGVYHTVALDTGGNIWTWGGNEDGQLGNGARGPGTESSIPVKVKSDRKFTQISAGFYHTVAIDTMGQAWAWGSNNSGQLGNSTSGLGFSKSTPVQVSGGHKFTRISARFHTIALDENGDTWAWGDNEFGQLGDGTTTDKSTPVQVADGHRFTRISAGRFHTVAIDENGNVWTWGWNNYGQLGDGTTTDKNTPVKVLALLGP